MKNPMMAWMIGGALLPAVALAAAGGPAGTDSLSPVTAPTLAAASPMPATAASVYNVRSYGATGDGTMPDTDAINRAIAAASAAGGGTVYFPAGNYLSFTIVLKSNITLYLDNGAVLVAADGVAGQPGYLPPEPNQWGDLGYQDFGHSHFQNSLIYGEGLDNIGIVGPGRIWGRGLLRDGGQQAGLGNKSIALKWCRNVTLRDFTLFKAGWFALLATGVDNLTVDNLKVDTDRDGFDIDCCHNVRVTNCSVNSPRDDGICLKSSYALGQARATEDVTITNCIVSGYDMGTVLDATYRGNGGTGRIKFGTESNGGFKNIAISNCVFDHCQGLAIESVDGGVIQDVSVNNLTMRTIGNAPIFIRLGSRMRGPKDAAPSVIERVNISNVVASDVSRQGDIMVIGTTGQPIKDVSLSDIRIVYRGGGTTAMAAVEPPEDEPRKYPEPGSFGNMPAYGLFARHVEGLSVRQVNLSYAQDEARPLVMLEDVTGATFEHLKGELADGTPHFVLKSVKDFTTETVTGIPNQHQDTADAASL